MADITSFQLTVRPMRSPFMGNREYRELCLRLRLGEREYSCVQPILGDDTRPLLDYVFERAKRELLAMLDKDRPPLPELCWQPVTPGQEPP